jgi:hypothetical protein
MTIRLKILALFTLLLLLFGIAIGVTVRLERHINTQLGSMAKYHLPLTALAGKTEVDAAEYRLTLARLISSGGRDPLMVRVLNGERQQLNARLRARFDSTDALLRNAVADSKNDVGNRLVFANVQGRFQVMRAKMEPLQAIVAQIFEAYLAGRAEDGLAGPW